MLPSRTWHHCGPALAAIGAASPAAIAKANIGLRILNHLLRCTNFAWADTSPAGRHTSEQGCTRSCALPAKIAVAGGLWPPSRVTGGRASPLLGRVEPCAGLVILRQTFVPRGQTCVRLGRRRRQRQRALSISWWRGSGRRPIRSHSKQTSSVGRAADPPALREPQLRGSHLFPNLPTKKAKNTARRTKSVAIWIPTMSSAPSG